MAPKKKAAAGDAAEGGPSTAVRIMSISAAQNKRGKDCYEGGMKAGSFTWYKDMGGNSNWMYLAVSNATREPVSLALWLLYEAATEPLVDPLCAAGDTQVGFFNQSKNLNRQVPLFELAEESKPMLEMAAGEAATLKVRINDLSSHHQNQRFILVAGPQDAPIRGSRSVPIEIMSKPRLDQGGGDAASQDGRAPGKRPRGADGGADGGGAPGAKRAAAAAAPAAASLPYAAALASVTDPRPTPARQVDLTVALLQGLPDKVRAAVAEKLAKSLDARTKMALLDALAEDVRTTAERSRAPPAAPPPQPRARFKSLAKAIVEFKRNEKQGARTRGPGDAGLNDSLGLSAEQLEAFFVDEVSGANLFNDLTPRNDAGHPIQAKPPPPQAAGDDPGPAAPAAAE